VTYQFRFRGLLHYVDLLIDGTLTTIQLTVAAALLGLAIGIGCALLRTQGPRATRRLVDSYVEIIRNTPLLVQCFFVFFGLPSAGVRMTAGQAAVVALSFNFGAYVTEIIRAGIESIHPSQIEGAAALGLSRLQIFRYIILFPAVRNVYPSLTSQFILLLLGSSIVSQISAKELTYS
jgi:polar amino acid transport system permease protein